MKPSVPTSPSTITLSPADWAALSDLKLAGKVPNRATLKRLQSFDLVTTTPRGTIMATGSASEALTLRRHGLSVSLGGDDAEEPCVATIVEPPERDPFSEVDDVGDEEVPDETPDLNKPVHPAA